MASGINFDYFLDRPKVAAMLTRNEQRFLNRVGGQYRLVVKRSMRSGKATKRKDESYAAPGQPPRYHTKLLRDNIFYQYDPEKSTVIVGSRKLNGTDGNIPRVLEFGGTAQGRKKRDRDRNLYGQYLTAVRFETFSYQMRPRPFVGETSVNWPIALDIMRKNRKLLW
jgi:hypothetical protein